MPKIPEVIIFPTPIQPDRKLYFDNNKVEDLMLRYRWTGCTDIKLRDAIMVNTEELIRQVIRAHNLHRIYPGQDESAFMDLYQTAWSQLERVLYKYKARVHCGVCYSPVRPMDSCIYDPPITEYDMLKPEDVAKRKLKCPQCHNIPIKIIYRGTSKLFNMWCVRPDTVVFTTDGFNTIDNVATRNGFDDRQEIYTLGVNGIPTKVVAGMVKPVRPILDIKTELGFGLGCTPEHSIACLKDDIFWQRAGDIKKGDLIAIQYNQQFFINNDDISDIKLTNNKPGCSGVVADEWQPPKILNEELVYIIGLYIAEGSYSQGQFAIYNIDQEVIDRLVSNKLGLRFTNHPKMQCTICCNKRFIEFIKILGFGKERAHTKHIPARLLKISKPNMIAMISGMFDGDGHSSRYNGTVGYTSTSIKLINQLRMLLLNLGIITKIHEDTRTISKFNRRGKTYESYKRVAYQLLCSTSQSEKFYNEIGFRIVRKQAKKLCLWPSRDLIHGINDKFRQLHKLYGCGSLGYDSIRTIIRSDRAKCSIDTAATLLKNWANHSDDINYKFIEARLAEYSATGIKTIWLPIISIKASKSPVCEISVESDDHSYIANGVVVHNSQISRTVILAYIKKESRDAKNSDSYRVHLDNKHGPKSDALKRFLDEARQICKYNLNYKSIIDALEYIAVKDPRPQEGIIGKLVKLSGQSRAQVAIFLHMIRLRANEFSDSPLNEKQLKMQSVATDDE